MFNPTDYLCPYRDRKINFFFNKGFMSKIWEETKLPSTTGKLYTGNFILMEEGSMHVSGRDGSRLR